MFDNMFNVKKRSLSRATLGRIIKLGLIHQIVGLGSKKMRSVVCIGRQIQRIASSSSPGCSEHSSTLESMTVCRNRQFLSIAPNSVCQLVRVPRTACGIVISEWCQSADVFLPMTVTMTPITITPIFVRACIPRDVDHTLRIAQRLRQLLSVRFASAQRIVCVLCATRSHSVSSVYRLCFASPRAL